MRRRPFHQIVRCCAMALGIVLTPAPARAAEPVPAGAPSVERASLQIVTRDPMDFEREMWRLEGGAWIVKVKPEGAAGRAGIGLDDVIAAIDDVAIADSAALLEALRARRPGDKVRVRIVRRGHPVEMDATLGAAR